MQSSEIEERYFEAWRAHDWELLEAITEPDISYEIDGKDGFSGHDQLRAYWERNRDRQKDLVVRTQQIDSARSWSTHTFYSRFYNVPKGEYQIVFGLIRFQFSGSGKIARLTEKYQKILEAPPEDRRPMYIRARDGLKQFASRFSAVNAFRAIVSTLVYGVYIFAAIVAVLLLVFEATPYAGLIASLSTAEFWRNEPINPAQLDERVEAIRGIFLWTLSSSTILYFLGDKISVRLEGHSARRVHRVKDRNRDASRLMARYLSGARKVSIFSGDFDFFEDSEELLTVFRDLQGRGELAFFSERSSQDISRAVANLPRTADLLNRLRASGKVFFNSNVRNARATIFEKDGITQILNLQNSRKFVVLLGVDENEATVKLLRGMLEERKSEALGKGMQASLLGATGPRTIFVCGECGAGKTSLCRALQALGYNYVSVSEVLRELSDVPLSSRSDLIAFGKALADDNDGKRLYDALCGKIAASGAVVVDGLRLPGVWRRLSEDFAPDTFTVYVVVDREEQTRRINQAIDSDNGPKITVQTIRASEKQFGVAEICAGADLIVSGESSVDGQMKKLKSAIGIV